MSMSSVRLIECPRDAIQGWPHPVNTDQKICYLNSLLKVGFDTLDFGSFVSPKAIPQMADTKEVLSKLQLTGSHTKLLAIVANERGAEEAVAHDEIHYLGFPFSVSETFQQRNTNSSINESLKRVETIQERCANRGKEMVVYLSMGFGNPYGDDWNEEIVFGWARQLHGMGVQILSVADTVGLATAEQVEQIVSFLIQELPQVETGVHLHSTYTNWKEKLEAAYNAGCRRFDGALKGIGGCPMAGNELVGNMNTEWMIEFFEQKGVLPQINRQALQKSIVIASEIFGQ